MSLSAALQIGRSALTASQIGLQVTGNNMANAATVGYSRQVTSLVPARSDSSLIGARIGRGVNVADVQRQIDQALQSRLWTSVSDEHAALHEQRVLAQAEAMLNELSDSDLSSQMSAFFDTWSEATNLQQSASVVIGQGSNLAAFMRHMREDLTNLRAQIDGELRASIERADAVLTELAAIDVAVVEAETHASANALRDQRDILVSELSEYLDINVVEQGSGHLDVFVGSTPIMLAGASRGIDFDLVSDGGEVRVDIRVQKDRQVLDVRSGVIGGLLQTRNGRINSTIGAMDDLARNLVFEVNRRHAVGHNAQGLSSTTSNLVIPIADRSLALNDPDNATFGRLPFEVKNGGLYVNVTQEATGTTRSVRIDVDLDGIQDDGSAGFEDDTSIEEIRAALDDIAGLNARFTPDGRLEVSSTGGYSFHFSEDSSDALAVLGINAYFEGTDARTFDVDQDLVADPDRLALGGLDGDLFVENQTAMRIATLRDQGVAGLGGSTFGDRWNDDVQALAVSTSEATTRSSATRLVRESLDAQRSSLSGVSLDEEAMNLLNFQRQYQGAARLVSVADELMQTLIGLV